MMNCDNFILPGVRYNFVIYLVVDMDIGPNGEILLVCSDSSGHEFSVLLDEVEFVDNNMWGWRINFKWKNRVYLVRLRDIVLYNTGTHAPDIKFGSVSPIPIKKWRNRQVIQKIPKTVSDLVDRLGINVRSSCFIYT